MSTGTDHAQQTLCSCQRYCGDVSEAHDDAHAICKGLSDPPRRPCVEVVMVHRNDPMFDRRRDEGT